MNLLTALWLLSILLSLSIGLVLGLSISWLKRRLQALQTAVVALQKQKADAKPPEKPKTFIADPDDLIQRAKYERDQARENLNR